MFTGIVREVGRAAAIGAQRRWAPPGDRCPRDRGDDGGRRLGRGQRLLPDGGRDCRRADRLRRRARDARPDLARRARRRRPRQHRALAACRRAARRPQRPGPRRRGRDRPERRGRGRGTPVWIDAAPELLRYAVEKGSIAVDGVSLTVAALDEPGFAVALIPHTLAVTTLGELAAGRPVNLEVDVLAKYVERLLPVRRLAFLHGNDDAVRRDRRGDRGDPRRPLRRRRRRSRPRERGRPRDRRAVRDARDDQLHGHARRAA